MCSGLVRVIGIQPLQNHSLNGTVRITKMRENCLKQFDEHWNCLEANNQVMPNLHAAFIPKAHGPYPGILQV